MKRKRSIDVDIIPNPHRDYSGKPHTNLQGRWSYRGTGTIVTGALMLDHMLGHGTGFDGIKPGDKLRITVEINPEEEDDENA